MIRITSRNVGANVILFHETTALLSMPCNVALEDLECARTLLAVGWDPRHVAVLVAMPSIREPGTEDSPYGYEPD